MLTTSMTDEERAARPVGRGVAADIGMDVTTGVAVNGANTGAGAPPAGADDGAINRPKAAFMDAPNNRSRCGRASDDMVASTSTGTVVGGTRAGVDDTATAAITEAAVAEVVRAVDADAVAPAILARTAAAADATSVANGGGGVEVVDMVDPSSLRSAMTKNSCANAAAGVIRVNGLGSNMPLIKS